MPATAPSNRYRERSEESSPKRSESSTAIGRAPTAKMSRRIPPTPVAAPWKGSTALGWLCDSTLKATARPPPTSTAPAFSPGPITTFAPSGGNRHRQGLEQRQSVRRAGERVDGVLGMGHQPEDVAVLVRHAGDVLLRA